MAFLSHVARAGGGELRPPGFYTLNCMGLLDMIAVEGPEEKPVLKLRSDALAARDLSNTYLFLHAAPVPDIERAVRAYDRDKERRGASDAWEIFVAERVAPFIATLAPEELVKLQAELSSLDEISAAHVAAEPPEHGAASKTDPNS